MSCKLSFRPDLDHHLDHDHQDHHYHDTHFMNTTLLSLTNLSNLTGWLSLLCFHLAHSTGWAESISGIGLCLCVCGYVRHHFEDDHYFWNNQNHLLVLSADTCGLSSLWEVSALKIVSTGAVPLRARS